MVKTLGLIGVLFLSCCYTAPAYSHEETKACAERNSVIKNLKENFKEDLRGVGLNNKNNTVVEFYFSEETKTWTIIFTRPDGKSCLLSAGRMWEMIPFGELL